MEEKKEFNTVLSRANELYMPLIERQLKTNEIEFNPYARKCVLNAVASINQLLTNQGIAWNDPALDQSNLTQILLNVASLELNTVAEPRECYFQIRNVKRKQNGAEVWKKVIELGIEGDGNDHILARFGRNVKKVYPFWLVREGDGFAFPRYNGVQITPPYWEPRGTGEVVRIVYPVLHTDDTIHYYIGEREDVKKNLLAHINNNLMNETFGFCKDRYKATPEELKKIAAEKARIKTKAKELGFKAIEDPEVSPYISPSWKEDFSRESMIIRKIRNNIVKKIPKDFGHPMIQETYITATDDEYRKARENIIESTATVEVVDLKEELTAPAPEIDPQSGEIYEGNIPAPAEEKSPSEGKMERQVEFDINTRQKPSFD